MQTEKMARPQIGYDEWLSVHGYVAPLAEAIKKSPHPKQATATVMHSLLLELVDTGERLRVLEYVSDCMRDNFN